MPFGFVRAQQTRISNNYRDTTGLKHLKVERSMIFSPEKEWLYNHHPAITLFKGKLIAIWSDGMIDEDSAGQRVVFSVSNDFKKWSAPQELAYPSKAANGVSNVLTAAGFHQFNDTLVAYYGEYEKDRTHTHLWAKTSTDGLHWSAPIDMHVAVNPNHGPETIQGGRLIISGNFTFPYTDDHTGLSGWKMSSFYPDSLYEQDNPATFYKPAEKMGLPPLCEGSFFQTDDKVIHMLLRVTGKGWKGKLWLTESKDNDKTWSRPAETNFTDNDSKFHFGRLPDKRFYYVGIPDTLHHYDRNPLVLALSDDGKYFNKQYIIADGLYTLKKKGLWKGGQYGYPVTMVDKGYMYVIISRQKESIEVIRFKLSQLR
ncbi:exo-alpha-sialidase [Mucilaginibacter sp. BT774]|uniref:exo-alpha-sialidase n=1 Tax=Mucilaginibacter sp. BT774 TaxID=3062276 RepID=UPI00267694CA|nr:exo-alpha-sialidase [Mucilaginibacter sp. BT774]MDO3627313.1 exo-alpha-sialidase [Mucilaginibacter sp. BT774]